MDAPENLIALLEQWGPIADYYGPGGFQMDIECPFPLTFVLVFRSEKDGVVVVRGSLLEPMKAYHHFGYLAEGKCISWREAYALRNLVARAVCEYVG